MDELKQRSYSEWLVIRCQQGEEPAFRELVELWQPRYFLYALRRLHNRAAAQDVTQESLISIIRGLRKLDDPAAYPKWSFRILERRCVDWLRKTIRDRKTISDSDELPEIVIEDKNEEKLMVSRLLSELEPEVASVLRLYYLEGMSLQDIATISDAPVGTIKSRLYYARKQVSKIIEDTS